MPIIKMKFISRGFVRSHPEWLFVFGDNMVRRGYGGQAKEMRGEPNAVGIPTKREPTWSREAFFTDADYDTVKCVIDAELDKIRRVLEEGSTVVFPLDGIGTHRARLQARAPRIWKYLQGELKKLEEKYGK